MISLSYEVRSFLFHSINTAKNNERSKYMPRGRERIIKTEIANVAKVLTRTKIMKKRKTI
jgi:retron-type reverse transcriptase